MEKDFDTWISRTEMMTHDGLSTFGGLLYCAKQNQIDGKNDVSGTHTFIGSEQRRDERSMKISDDLTVKFENPDILFGEWESNLTPKLIAIVNDFIPKYLGCLINDQKYREKIGEVRIKDTPLKVHFIQ